MSTNPKDAVGLTKPRLDLVPPALLLHVAKAMANGAEKYGPFNWRENEVRLTVYIAAAMRHLLELLDGEDIARDSLAEHAAHVGACMGIILDAKETGNLIDDRPAKGCASDVIERMTTKSAPVAIEVTVGKAVELVPAKLKVHPGPRCSSRYDARVVGDGVRWCDGLPGHARYHEDNEYMWTDPDAMPADEPGIAIDLNLHDDNP